MMDEVVKGSPVSIQSTIATKKMVSSAATEDSTGEVREIMTKKDPEKAATSQYRSGSP